MAKHPGGRPTKYRKEFCKQLEDWMAQGMSFRSFGAEVDCTEETLHDWKEKFPEFSESYKKGIALMSKYFERLGHAMMTGKIKGNPAILIFTLKNKLQWQDKIEITGNQDKPLRMLYSLDEDPDSLHTHQRTGTDDQSGKGTK